MRRHFGHRTPGSLRLETCLTCQKVVLSTTRFDPGSGRPIASDKRGIGRSYNWKRPKRLRHDPPSCAPIFVPTNLRSRTAPNPSRPASLSQQFQETYPIFMVTKDRLASITPTHHVINRICVFHPQCPRHPAIFTTPLFVSIVRCAPFSLTT